MNLPLFYISLEFERPCKPSNDNSDALKVVIIEEISKSTFGDFKGLYPLDRKATSSDMEDAHQFHIEAFTMVFGARGESTMEALMHVLDILNFIDVESEMSDFEITIVGLDEGSPMALSGREKQCLLNVLARTVTSYNYNHIGVAYKEE